MNTFSTNTWRAVALLGSVLVTTASLTACGSSGNGGSSQADGCAVIKVGDNETITGSAASVGVPFQKGFVTAVAGVNEPGVTVGGKCYTFSGDVQDNKTDPATAIAINKTFVATGVKFVFGPQPGVIFAPAFQSLRNTDTMVFTAAATATPLLGTDEGKYLLNPLLATEGPQGEDAQDAEFVIGKFAPKRVALLLVQDASGDQHLAQMTKTFGGAGVDIVYSQQFDRSTRDFSSYVTAIKDTNPDVVVVGYLDQYAKPFFQQAAAGGLTSPVFLGSRGVTSAAVDPGLSRYVLSVPTVPVSDGNDLRLTKFREVFKKTTGAYPTESEAYAASFWDALHMLAKAMEITGTVDDLDQLAAAMRTDAVKNYPGRMMDITFDRAGQSEYVPNVQLILDGATTFPKATTS